MMTTHTKIIQNYKLCIVDRDTYARKVKLFLYEQFGAELTIYIFNTAESLLKSIRANKVSPQVVLIDFNQNKPVPSANNVYAVNAILALCPDTKIIMLSDEATSLEAQRALAHGAHDFVMKDQFDTDHISTVVARCFHPATV